MENEPNLVKRLTCLFRTIADVAENTMGGSSGAMYSLMFEAASRHLETEKEVTKKALTLSLNKGLEAMMK